MHTSSGSDTPVVAAPHTVPAEDDRERLFELSLDLLCIAGLDGYFKQVNPSWTRVLGWSKEELLSRPVHDFMHPEDRERTLQARANLAKGIPVRGLENRYLCKDGSYRWLSWQSSIEPGASTVFAVARDVTERRQADHQHLVLSKLESMGVLAGGIAHDFNNLLASLMLSVEMVGVIGPTTEQQKELLRQAVDIVRSSKYLTQQLLTVAHLDSGSARPTDLKPLLRDAMDLALSGSSLIGQCTLAPDLWTACVNETQLGQVIRNLVLNAKDASPPGGTIHLRAENKALTSSLMPELPSGDYVHISVTDQGAGISADTLTKVFDPYFSTKERGQQKGMGLGLTICHAVIQKHGGAIVIDSSPGSSTTVHCYLPGTPAIPPVANAPAAAIPVTAPNSSRKILVMDDEPYLLEMVAQSLTQMGYTAELAKTGEEAIALYEQAHTNGHPFAAVLLDLTIRGGMGGAETIRILRERDPAVRAVLMTGYNHTVTLGDHARHGFNAALAKPFLMETLRTTLTEVLGVKATS